MIDFPKTLDQASIHRYGEWAGNPKGTKYNPKHCAYEVWPIDRGMIPHQCRRNNGHGPNGLFCWQHASTLEKQNVQL